MGVGRRRAHGSVEITLDPGEACVAEAGSFMYMDPGIRLETIFGAPVRWED